MNCVNYFRELELFVDGEATSWWRFRWWRDDHKPIIQSLGAAVLENTLGTLKDPRTAKAAKSSLKR